MRLLKSSVAACALLSASFAAVAYVAAKPVDARGHLGQEVLIQAYYQYDVMNSTDHIRHYRCDEKLKVAAHQWVRSINFYLKPNERRKVTNDIGFVRFIATQKGDFVIDAEIKLNGEGGGEAKEKAMLTITS